LSGRDKRSAMSLGIYWRAVVPTAIFSAPRRTRTSALQKIPKLNADPTQIAHGHLGGAGKHAGQLLSASHRDGMPDNGARLAFGQGRPLNLVGEILQLLDGAANLIDLLLTREVFELAGWRG